MVCIPKHRIATNGELIRTCRSGRWRGQRNCFLEIAGGAAGPVVGYGDASVAPPPIPLRHQRLERLLGGPFAREAAEVLLTRLNMTWQRTDQGWEATAPSYRFDLKIEADLIEELIRLRGYAALEAQAPTLALRPVTIPEMAVSPGKLRQLLVERGYYEAITYSFVDPEVQQAFLAGAMPIDLANPLSRELSQMRTSLWPGLVQALKANLKRQSERVRLFEMGKVFRREDTRIVQEKPAERVGVWSPLAGTMARRAPRRG